MNVYRVTIQLVGQKPVTGYRVFQEDLDMVFACLRKSVYVLYGQSNVSAFECLQVSKLDRNYGFAVHAAGYDRQPISVFTILENAKKGVKIPPAKKK